jgi:integrase/recombinase XerD
MVPIGERALKWIDKYIREARSPWVREPDEGWLWLSVAGEMIIPSGISEIVRDYITAANLGKKGSCHLFRHTMATLMLENGADIRYIQAMLGHAKLDTTEIYTQVSIRKLKEVHTLTHPSSVLRTTEGKPARLDRAKS